VGGNSSNQLIQIISIDQFDWFVFETRIRNFIKEEYMKPMVEK